MTVDEINGYSNPKIKLKKHSGVSDKLALLTAKGIYHDIKINTQSPF